MADSNSLAQRNIQSIMDELVDIRQYTRMLRWVNRIPFVDALDEEIMGRYAGKVRMADIILDDQRAVIYSPQPIRLTQTSIPNIKHGELMSQAQIKLYNRIQQNLAGSGDLGVFQNYIDRKVLDCTVGVLFRIEALLLAMLTDSFSYDRLGIKISGLTWGMPSDLKVTPANLWSDATNATPIADIQNLLTVANEKYGMNYNRISFSRASLNYLFATTEFRNKATVYSQLVLPSAANFPKEDLARMEGILGMMLGMQIEVDDRQAFTEGDNGTMTAVRLQPVNKAILTNTENDNNPSMMDFANGEVIETYPGMVPNLIGSMDGGRRGPVGYVTSASSDGNPPGMVMWGVASGFPRKHNEAASAVITTN